MIDPSGLLRLQNSDGGWGFHGGGSWTEPTCFALLALSTAGIADSESNRRAVSWLSSRQQSDGGWAPRAGVNQSTWVTALALLLPHDLIPPPRIQRAAHWVASQTGKESSFIYRLRMRLLNVPSQGPVFDGWAWYPGAAAWVTPTALSILAMEKFARITGSSAWHDRIEQGRSFLLSRRCRDGGWNHGSTAALGYDSDSYPETTGVALLALHDSRAPGLDAAESTAIRHLEKCP